ncbi:MAG: type III pantothenate kinase [Clostridiales bacterium]|jgi:type III pantothenate kinase|nr:type III pantothenate kinase [Clostridiales bacterium]
MVLVIDIGNTNVKLGIFKDNFLMASGRIATHYRRTSDEYGLLVTNLIEANNLSKKDITGIIISSVIPDLNYTFEHMCDFYFGITPLVLGAGVKTGLNIKYDNPKDVGSDRIAICVAAMKEYGKPLIVVDFGTATTVNVIGRDNEFLGGLICPGIKTSLNSLAESTAKLPKIELVTPKSVIGKSTVTNMQSGMFYGFVGLLEHIIKKIKEEENLQDAKVIATGGLSEYVVKGTNVIDRIDRRLSLKGLNYIYQMNDPTVAK